MSLSMQIYFVKQLRIFFHQIFKQMDRHIVRMSDHLCMITAWTL